MSVPFSTVAKTDATTATPPPKEDRAYVVTFSRKAIVTASSAKDARTIAMARASAGAYGSLGETSAVTRVRRDPYGWAPAWVRAYLITARFNTRCRTFFDFNGRRFLTNGHMFVCIGRAADPRNAAVAKTPSPGSAGLMATCQSVGGDQPAKPVFRDGEPLCGVADRFFNASYIKLVERLWFAVEWRLVGKDDESQSVAAFARDSDGEFVVACVMGLRR